MRIKDHFAKVRPRYTQFMSAITGVETEIFKSQIPGGMISNMESQLRQQGAGDRLREVLLEVPRVRAVAGYPPLVTPSSQIVGTQAVFNVLMGPYKVLTAEFADLMLGYYGETIGERDPAIIEAAQAQTGKEPIDIRPADLIPPEWDKLVSEASALEGYDGTDEDVLTYAMFPGVAPKFFTERPEGPKNVGKDPVEVASRRAVQVVGRPGEGADPLLGEPRRPQALGLRRESVRTPTNARHAAPARPEGQARTTPLDGGAHRPAARTSGGDREGRRRGPPGEAACAGQADRPRAGARAARPRHLRGDRMFARHRRPTSGSSRPTIPQTAW